MTNDDRTEEQLKAAREQAEGLLKCAVAELRSLLVAPEGASPGWFPHGVDGVKVSVKLSDVEVSLELEGAVPPQPGDDED